LDEASGVSPTSRTVYIALGIFLGELGVHNFVAGRIAVAISQLIISLVSIPLMCFGIGFVTMWIPFIWALVEVIVIQHDGKGRRML
jgi:TM2 domain-containing membrane protein YozV